MPVIYCETLDQIRACYKALKPCDRVAYDLETTGLDPHTDRILLAQYCPEGSDTVYVVPARGHLDALTHLAKLLATRTVIAHNGSFEYQFTKTNLGVTLPKIFDTQLNEAILTAGTNWPTGLGDTVLRRLGQEMDKGLQTSFVGADPETFLPTPEQIAYAAADVAILHQLAALQLADLHTHGMIPVGRLEAQALPVFAEMELAGLYLDLADHAPVVGRFREDLEHYGTIAISTLDPYWQASAQRRAEVNAPQYAHVSALIDGGRAAYDLRSTPTPAVDWSKPTKAQQALLDRINKLMARVSEAEALTGGPVQPLAPNSPELLELRKQRDKLKPKAIGTLSLTSRDQVLAALAESGLSLPDLTAETVAEHQAKSPVLKAYAVWAKAQKVVSTYGDSLASRVNPKTGRVHFRYRQIVSTGRTSSDGAQVMPPNIRACFKPMDGNVFVVADFAAMEMRIAAGLFQDPAMMEAINKGYDLHKVTAAAAWPEEFPGGWETVPKDSPRRAIAKIGNFAAIYGATVAALVFQMGLQEEDAERVLKGIATAYPVMWAAIHETGEQAVHTGYAVTALGRRRFFPKLPPQPRSWAGQREWKKARNRIVRQAMNHPVQGTGADIAKKSMYLIHQEIGEAWPARIVAMVHDEILVECLASCADQIAQIVGDSMKRAGAELIRGVEIPAEVHIVERWKK